MEYTYGTLFLLVLATYPQCCVSVCPTDGCPANSHCTGGECVCDEGYYLTAGVCTEVYPECASDVSLANIADLCHIDRSSVEDIRNGAPAQQCGKYRQAVACAVTNMQLYVQPACTPGYIIGVLTGYMAQLVPGLSEANFGKYSTCAEYRKRVRVQATQETWTSDLADTGGAAYWGVIKQYRPLIYGLLTSAFPKTYVTHSIVGVSLGSVLLDTVFELTENVSLTDAIKEINTAVNSPEYSTVLELKFVSHIGKSCSYNGETLSDGTSFLEVEACTTCLCNNGEITCSTMDCSNAWLYEYCSTTSDCATGNANCFHNRCWCSDGFYDTINVKDDPVGQCIPVKESGTSCNERRECAGDRAACINSVCGCDVMYEPVGGICNLPLLGECAETPDCDVTNSECIHNICQCSDGFYDKDGTCARLKSLGETCSATTDCGDASSECRGGKCVCMVAFFEVESLCEPVPNPGEECAQSVGCGVAYLWCLAGTCHCGDQYYQAGTTCEPATPLGESCNDTVVCAGRNSDCISSICTCNTNYHVVGSTCQADGADSQSGRDKLIAAAVGASGGAVILAIGIVMFLFYRRRQVAKNKKARANEFVANETQRQYGLQGLTAPGSVFLAAGKSRDSSSRYQTSASGELEDGSQYYSELQDDGHDQTVTDAHAGSTDPAEIMFTNMATEDIATYDRLKPSGSAVVVCVTPAGSPAHSPIRDMLMSGPSEGPVTFYEPGLLAPDGSTQREAEAADQQPANDDGTEEDTNLTYYPLSHEGGTIVVCVTPAGSPDPSPTREMVINWPTTEDPTGDATAFFPIQSESSTTSTTRDPVKSKFAGRHSPQLFPNNRSPSNSATRDVLKSANMLAAITDLNPEGTSVNVSGSPKTSSRSSPTHEVSADWTAI